MDGNITLSTDLDTRPVEQSLSNLKRKIVEVFKGADIGALQTGFRQVTAEIKATEAQARKAQAALDALMSGEKVPQSVKDLERELAATEKQAEKMSKGYDKMLADVEKYSSYAGLSTKSFPEAQKLYDAQAALERYEKEWEALDLKAEELRTTLDTLKQNPQLTPEAQRYAQTVRETSARLTELRSRQEELGASAQKVGLMTRLQQNSVVSGFQHIERRIMGLVKRVFFFTLITKALRSVRSQVSALIASDSQLSASLAQVRGNLATSFGMIWQAVVPAIRVMVAWLAKATAYIAAFISWLTGKSFKQGQDAFQAANTASAGTAKNTGKIGKAAKKAAKEAQKMLLPFDQMNVLSKDNADSGAGGGGGGAGGGGGGLGNMAWPKDMDNVMAKFEKFKDLIMLIGAAFIGWKLAKVLGPLLGLSKSTAFLALTSIVFGIFELISGIRSLIKEGPNVNNVCQIIAGALLIVGGALTIALGPVGLIISAIGLLVLGFKYLYNNVASFKKYIDGALKRIKKAFSKGKLAGFKQIGKEILLGILKGIVTVVKKLGSWIKKNVVEPFKKWFKKKFGIHSPAKEMLDIGKNIILGVLEGILEPMKKIGSWIQEHVFTPIKEALLGGEDNEGLFVNIGAKFEDTKESLKQKWDSIKEGIAETWANIKSKFEDTKEKLKQKWEDIKSGISETWANIKSKFEDTKEGLKAKWENIKSGLAETWVDIKSKFSDTKENLQSKWNNLTAGISDKTATITASVKEAANGALDKVKSVFSYGGRTVSATIRTVVTGVSVKTLQKVSKALGKIKWGNKVLNASINLKAAVSSAYNSAANKINGLINKLPAAIRPSWRLPTLAQGAVIPANKEFLAVLGDQKRGVNIETPLSTMVDAFNQALRMNGMSGNQNINVYLQGDAKQLFRVVRVEANNYTQSTGKAAFNL